MTVSNNSISDFAKNINRKNIKNYDSNGNVSNTNPTASKDMRHNTTRYDELVDEYGAMEYRKITMQNDNQMND